LLQFCYDIEILIGKIATKFINPAIYRVQGYMRVLGQIARKVGWGFMGKCRNFEQEYAGTTERDISR
jgi:hypothetical protein